MQVAKEAIRDSLGQEIQRPSGPQRTGWQNFLIQSDSVFREGDPLFTINGKPFINQSAIITVTGRAKIGKTFFTQSIALAGLKGQWMNIRFEPTDAKPTILVVDTEQGNSRTQLFRHRMNRVCGDAELSHLITLSVRMLSPKKRVRIIKEAIQELRPTLVIIDGIRDCVIDINSIQESMDVVNLLMQLATELCIAIVVVIHQNKADGNIRGHLGAELSNKSETVVELTKKGDVIRVSPMLCRDIEFDPFGMRITEDGLTELCELPCLSSKETKGDLTELFEQAFGQDQKVDRKELLARLQRIEQTGERTASRRIKAGIEDEIIRRLPDGTYCLLEDEELD